MKHKALVILGLAMILVGYDLTTSGGRVTKVRCERTESAYLPVCHLSEYFLGWFPMKPTETVGEITALSQTGKFKKDFYLVQRLENRRLAPVELNRVVIDGRSNDQEPLASYNRLAQFFRSQSDLQVDVTLPNEAGHVPGGVLLLIMGVALVLYARVDHQLRKPKSVSHLDNH